MSEWISVEDRLPEDGDVVLADVYGRPWGVKNRKAFYVVVEFVKGISQYERESMSDGDSRKAEINGADQHGNNLLPYCWTQFGPGSFFGQEVKFWMPLPEPPQ